MKKYIILLFVVVGVFYGLISRENKNNEKVYSKKELVDQFEKHTTSFQSSLNDKKLEVLIDELNTVTTGAKIESVEPIVYEYVSDLKKRVTDDPTMNLISYIEDQKNTIVTRSIFIELLSIKKQLSIEDIKYLYQLLESEEPIELKKQVITMKHFYTTENIEILIDIINQRINGLSEYALETLSFIDEESSYKQSLEILNNYNIDNVQLNASAIRKQGRYYGIHKNLMNEKNVFINKANEILNQSNIQIEKDAAILALTDLNDVNVIYNLITNENIDLEMKTYAIYTQANLLLKEINTAPPQNIEIIFKAMEIMPINDFIEPLTEYTEKLTDQTLRNKYEDIISNIKNNGVKLKQKD